VKGGIQESEVRRRKAEIRKQKSETRNQKTETRTPNPEPRIPIFSVWSNLRFHACGRTPRGIVFDRSWSAKSSQADLARAAALPSNLSKSLRAFSIISRCRGF
jgi:hypothetical protein